MRRTSHPFRLLTRSICSLEMGSEKKIKSGTVDPTFQEDYRRELKPEDFAFFEGKASFVYGAEDPYVNKEFLESERRKKDQGTVSEELEICPF